ncbi:MAG: TraB/GumN family protein [Deltaproteobacteria bacterium]|nr:TraB/GumN family protein [Deltaproteobacteria bacterium]
MIENNDVHRLSYNGKEIIIIGTAHVSQKSADLVREVIEDEKPDTVCIELCDSRFQAMTQKQKWQDTDLYKIIKEKKATLLLANFMLASIQKKIGKKLGIKPGEEMAQAIRSAESAGSKIHLADRDIRTTLSRAWKTITFWEKLKLMAQFSGSLIGVDDISEEEVEKLKDKDMLETLLSEIGETQPKLKTILIDERDKYLTEKIRTAPGERIVAVVGAGHVPGIKAGWEASIDLNELDKKPEKGHWGTILAWGIPALIIAMFAASYFMGGKDVGTDMILFWLVANLVFTAIGAAVAFAHPFTIIAAALSSPFTSLHPLIASGWVAGIVQVLISKPKVRDFESLPDDITSVKGFWHNKITRILLVVVLTNLGTTFGNFLSIIIFPLKTFW